MKPADTKRIYERACREKRMEAKQDEMNLWHRVLREFNACDVEGAMEAWWASTAVDSNGDLKSKWLPAPAELKPLVIAAQRKREAAAREPQDVLLWECEGGQHHRYSGFIGRSKLPPASRCRYCNAHMKLVERQVA